MSLHYILDGYNIVKLAFSENSGKLQASREKLLEFIRNSHPQGSPKNKVTVVFDGKEDFLPENTQSLPEVIFTRNESADEKIKKIVELAKNPKELVVVSNDRDITLFSRRLGAKILSVDEFLASKKKARTKVSEDAKNIPASAEFNITEELKRVWLR
jgi:Protein of unknown function (DUF901).